MTGLALLALVAAPTGRSLAEQSVANDPATTQSDRDLPLEIYQLPWELRRALPVIKVTVRHAPEDPEKRFVKINGERFVQGDNMELGPRIVEIRTDGVILEFQGQLLIIR